MDKRSLLFIACVSASFFAIHTISELWRGNQSSTLQIVQEIESNKTFEKPKLTCATNDSFLSDYSDEIFYVLQNDYQQLVFSSKGGSLAEINLPLKSSEDPKSIVKELDIDRKILKDSPQNGRFPLKPYYVNGNT